MNTTELYTLFRADVVDTKKPYLWSDVEVFSFMDDAQTMFTRLGLGIADTTTDEVVRVSVVTGEEHADVHPSILTFRRAELVSTNRPLALRNINDDTRLGDDYGRIFSTGTEHSSGPVRGMVIGEEYNKVRWVGVPTEDDEVRLSVYRLPICRLTARDQCLEIRSEHHRSLLAWMKHLAYSKQDAETFDRGKRDEYEAEFRAYCQKAKEEWSRYSHKPREIVYGGI